MKEKSNRVIDIAKAFTIIATMNHYMVGFINLSVNADELEMAKQILISEQNTHEPNTYLYDILERALDLIEIEIKGAKL